MVVSTVWAQSDSAMRTLTLGFVKGSEHVGLPS